MREHPIPQDITGYKFHIVGNMTLKQFAEVAIGFVVAFLIFKTNLIPYIKWPLAAISAGLGAALAFVPFEERPLDHWFVTFFTILYKPTKFYWKREPKVPEAFAYTATTVQKTQVNEVDLTPQRRQRIKEYLQSLNQPVNQQSEVLDQNQANQILSIFEDKTLDLGFAHQNSTKPQKNIQKPNLKVQVRSLKSTKKPHAPVDNTVEEVVLYENSQNSPTSQVDSSRLQNPLNFDVQVPEVLATKIEPTQQQAVEEQSLDETTQEAAYVQDSHHQTSSSDQYSQVTKNEDLPFPVRPLQPNKLVGMTLTPNGDLINNATIAIKKQDNTPVTAVKSNALGQFFINTPLSNGDYLIQVSKPGFTFPPLQLSLTGEIIDPLDVRSA